MNWTPHFLCSLFVCDYFIILWYWSYQWMTLSSLNCVWYDCLCKPLYIYVQINYADMLKRVEPLRDELHSLEVQAQENKNRGEEVTNLITQLEHSIASYKEEYAQLISQAQAIKTDLENVQAKVQSVRLLGSRLKTNYH